jgi:hypothetical protein
MALFSFARRLAAIFFAAPPMAAMEVADNFVAEVDLRLVPLLLQPGGAPMLKVEIRNITERTLSFMQFEDPACFADMYFHVTLSRGDRSSAKPTRSAPCDSKDFPGREMMLEPQKSIQKSLPLAQLFRGEKWKAGTYRLDAEWNPERLRGLGKERFALSVRAVTGGMETFRILPLVRGFSVKVGQTEDLGNGARLTFNSHGHKDIMAGGVSPLLIRATLSTKAGEPGDETSVAVFPRDSPEFSVDGHLFKLVDYEYGVSMRLEYYGPEK